MSYSLRNLLHISFDVGVSFDTPLFCETGALVSACTNGPFIQLNSEGIFDDHPDKPMTLLDILKWVVDEGVPLDLPFTIFCNDNRVVNTYTVDENKDRILFYEEDDGEVSIDIV